jgi:hypothetical protein
VIDCGEPVRVVWVLPATSAMLNEAAAVSVDVTEPPPAVAVEVAFTMQTVDDVCTIDETAEIPTVSVKSVPAVVESVVQSMASFPVTVKLIAAELAVAAVDERVTVAGDVRSIVIEIDVESEP